MKGPSSQTQFVTKELIKEAILEYITENPEMIEKALEELKDRLYYVQKDQARDKKRITDIELLLGLDESLRDPENIFYEENKERHNKLFSESIFSSPLQDNPNYHVQNLLYEELKRVPSMRNKDVLNFLGWDKKNTMKASRLMRSMTKTYNDVICDNPPGKKRSLRIYRKSS